MDRDYWSRALQLYKSAVGLIIQGTRLKMMASVRHDLSTPAITNRP